MEREYVQFFVSEMGSDGGVNMCEMTSIDGKSSYRGFLYICYDSTKGDDKATITNCMGTPFSGPIPREVRAIKGVIEDHRDALPRIFTLPVYIGVSALHHPPHAFLTFAKKNGTSGILAPPPELLYPSIQRFPIAGAKINEVVLSRSVASTGSTRECTNGYFGIKVVDKYEPPKYKCSLMLPDDKDFADRVVNCFRYGVIPVMFGGDVPVTYLGDMQGSMFKIRSRSDVRKALQEARMPIDGLPDRDTAMMGMWAAIIAAVCPVVHGGGDTPPIMPILPPTEALSRWQRIKSMPGKASAKIKKVGEVLSGKVQIVFSKGVPMFMDTTTKVVELSQKHMELARGVVNFLNDTGLVALVPNPEAQAAIVAANVGLNATAPLRKMGVEKLRDASDKISEASKGASEGNFDKTSALIRDAATSKVFTGENSEGFTGEEKLTDIATSFVPRRDAEGNVLPGREYTAKDVVDVLRNRLPEDARNRVDKTGKAAVVFNNAYSRRNELYNKEGTDVDTGMVTVRGGFDASAI